MTNQAQHKLRLVGTDKDPMFAKGGLFENLPRVHGRIVTGRDLEQLANTAAQAIQQASEGGIGYDAAARSATIYRNTAATIDGIVDGTLAPTRDMRSAIEDLSRHLHNAFFSINRSEHRIEQSHPNGGRSLTREARNAITADCGFEYYEMLQSGLDLLKLIDRKLQQDPVRSRTVEGVSETLAACLKKYAPRQF